MTEKSITKISKNLMEITEILTKDKLNMYSGKLVNGWRFNLVKGVGTHSEGKHR